MPTRSMLEAISISMGQSETELADVEAIDFATLKTLAGLQPVLAKRHYHETGALRWFELNLAPLQIVELAAHYQPDNGTVGQFLLAVPTEEEADEAARLCREAARHGKKWDIVVGISKHSWVIRTLARELIALENVRNDWPELAGDAVARREVTARLRGLAGAA